MLVKINLLPQKEQRSLPLKIAWGVLIAGMLLAGTWLGIDYSQAKSEAAQSASDLQQAQKLAELQKKEQAKSGSSDVSSAPLQEKIDYIKGREIPASRILKELVSYLPERGYFIDYKYEGSRTVNLKIQFDTMNASAQYLQDLTSAKIFKEAKLVKVEAKSLEPDDAKEEKDVLPRYFAEYSLTLDPTALQKKPTSGGMVQ